VDIMQNIKDGEILIYPLEVKKVLDGRLMPFRGGVFLAVCKGDEQDLCPLGFGFYFRYGLANGVVERGGGPRDEGFVSEFGDLGERDCVVDGVNPLRVELGEGELDLIALKSVQITVEP